MYTPTTPTPVVINWQAQWRQPDWEGVWPPVYGHFKACSHLMHIRSILGYHIVWCALNLHWSRSHCTFEIHRELHSTWQLHCMVMKQVQGKGVCRNDRTCFVAKLRTTMLEIPRGQEVKEDRTKRPGSGGWSKFLSLPLSNPFQPLLWTFDNSQVCSRR